MRLKIFFFPFALVMSLVWTVLYIEPEYTRAWTLYDEKAMLDEKASSALTRVDNISELTTSLSDNSLEQAVLGRYFPKTLDSGGLTDSFGFLASQSGVALKSIGIEEPVLPVDQQVVDESGAPAASDLVEPSFSDDGLGIPKEVIPPVVIKTSVVTISGSGEYTNVKDFLQKLAYTNRFNSIKTISINHSSDTDTGDSATLDFSVGAEFSFMEPVKHFKNASSVETNDVFASQTLDTKPVEDLSAFLERGAAIVPPLTLPDANGRSNPFIR